MGDEKIFTARFKVEDDGSIVLDKISGKLVDVGVKGQESLGKISSSLSIIKLDSLINLGERAFGVGQKIYGMAKSIASGTNEIERMSKISGLTTDTYQKLAYAAKMTDVDVESLGKGMKILAGHMDDARKGSTEAVTLFQSIGVSTLDASGKTKGFDEILRNLADRFKSMPDGVQKVALATDLFGKSGQNLIPMLNQGRTGLRGFYEEAQRLGIVLSDSVIVKGGEAEMKFKKLDAQIEAMKLRLAPTALAIAGFFASIVEDARKAGDYIERVAKKIEEASSRSIAAQEAWQQKRGYPERGTLTQQMGLGKTSGDIGRGLEAMGESAPLAYMRQSEEAIKAVAKALEKAAEQEMKLNVFYADDVELLKQANREVDRRSKALDIMEQLGIKTKPGAEREIKDIEEKFKSLLGQGFSTEEIGQARAKIEEQVKAVGEKYKTPSGWKAEGEEGGVRVWSSVKTDEMTRNVSEMVENSIKEINRMQKQIEQVTKGPTKIEIDMTAFDSANQAVEQLRKKLDDISRQNFPIHISIASEDLAGGRIAEVIEDNLITRYENKSSRLRTIIEKNIEGVIHYSNE
jgi:hypothetical protein